jgi:hypothetical protein
MAATLWDMGIKAHELCFYAALRELVRFIAWQRSSCPSEQGSKFRLSMSSGFIYMSIFLAEDAARWLEPHNLSDHTIGHSVGIAMLIGVTGMLYLYGGGIKNIYAAYKDTMFDYPRKKNPPRKPRKKSVLERLQEVWRGLKDKLSGPVPEGAFAPIPTSCEVPLPVPKA